MGKRYRSVGYNIQGILLFDKPGGLTSNKALQEVKCLFSARKAGHTGSLDPLATGLLPICFGNATRVSSFLLDADKRYDVICQLGMTTTTGDGEGEVVQTCEVGQLDLAKVNELLQSKFTGKISQIPPMHSALKHKGKRLYELAREGIEVKREPREINIYSLELLSLEASLLKIRIHCSKGTYVRTLVEDIGKELGTGAYVMALRRTSVGPFKEPKMYALEELRHLKESGVKLSEKLLLSAETALYQYPDIYLDADSAFYMKQGQAIQISKAPTDGWVRLYVGEGQFMGMGAIQDDGKVAPKRLFS